MIARSIENRSIDLLVITNKNNVCVKDDFSIETLKTKKPILFISARVHPGEVPASHVMNGILDYILLINPTILDKYVFLCVPMINPDGVYRGHWRVDSIG